MRTPHPLFCNVYANKGLTRDLVRKCLLIRDLEEKRRCRLQVTQGFSYLMFLVCSSSNFFSASLRLCELCELCVERFSYLFRRPKTAP
jgi:hypothetical protein